MAVPQGVIDGEFARATVVRISIPSEFTLDSQ